MNPNIPTTKPIEIAEVKPAYYAQKCPVCNGFGTLRFGKEVCHGCKGKGYILIPTEMGGGQNV